jgi:hypothetical protein
VSVAATSGSSGRHVPPGTSVQAGRASYYSGGGGRTVSAGGSSATAQGGQVRFQSPSGQRVTAALPSKTYHRIILAEFVTCVVLISAVPFLTPRKAGAPAGSEAVSLAAPLVRLTAVCILFFVLALMGSGQKSGKAAAAFGGLVTLGTLLNATDTITTLAAAFTAKPAAAAAAPAAPTGAVSESGVIEEA